MRERELKKGMALIWSVIEEKNEDENLEEMAEFLDFSIGYLKPKYKYTHLVFGYEQTSQNSFTTMPYAIGVCAGYEEIAKLNEQFSKNNLLCFSKTIYWFKRNQKLLRNVLYNTRKVLVEKVKTIKNK